jgi:hypothetical protein
MAIRIITEDYSDDMVLASTHTPAHARPHAGRRFPGLER